MSRKSNTASQLSKTENLTKQADSWSKARVRTYRHGLGDCHLLSLRKSNGDPFHILIDCGVVDVTPKPDIVMKGVVQDVAKEIRNPNVKRDTLDLVIATHQHTDHLSGFKQAKEEFEKLDLKRLWLAWTEDASNPLGKKIKQELVKGLTAVRAAQLRLVKPAGNSAQRIKGILDFFGPTSIAGEETQEILDYLKSRGGQIAYHNPGDLLTIPEVPNVRVYVLGPPQDAKALKICNPRKSKNEGYEETSLAADALGFVEALLNNEKNRDTCQPFDDLYKVTPKKARSHKFFKEHYGFTKKKPNEDWRKIDTAWLEGAEKLALALNNFTNNTSLALAFEFIDTGEVLLFPGDAQVGSWLTWQDLSWKVIDQKGNDKTVTMKDLFSRTIFYKAAHHASHNGTLGQLGLEMMTHRDLVSVVPVDKKMSIKKHWDRTLPWQPLLSRLKERTRGRLLLTDVEERAPLPSELTDLTSAERLRFQNQVKVQPHWIDYIL